MDIDLTQAEAIVARRPQLRPLLEALRALAAIGSLARLDARAVRDGGEMCATLAAALVEAGDGEAARPLRLLADVVALVDGLFLDLSELAGEHGIGTLLSPEAYRAALARLLNPGVPTGSA